MESKNNKECDYYSPIARAGVDDEFDERFYAIDYEEDDIKMSESVSNIMINIL